MQGLNIRHFDFSKEGRDQVLKTKKGQDWPVVYLIHNDKELYIGESSNMSNRFEQHLNNKERKGLKGIEIIFDDEFNKSAILVLIGNNVAEVFPSKLINDNFLASFVVALITSLIASA